MYVLHTYFFSILVYCLAKLSSVEYICSVRHPVANSLFTRIHACCWSCQPKLKCLLRQNVLFYLSFIFRFKYLHKEHIYNYMQYEGLKLCVNCKFLV